MSLLMTSLYDALKTAGSGEDAARKAAEEVAGYDNRFHKLEADLNLLKWMVGFNLAIATAILFKLFS